MEKKPYARSDESSTFTIKPMDYRGLEVAIPMPDAPPNADFPLVNVQGARRVHISFGEPIDPNDDSIRG